MVRNKQQRYRCCWELKSAEDVKVLLVCWGWKLPVITQECGTVTKD